MNRQIGGFGSVKRDDSRTKAFVFLGLFFLGLFSLLAFVFISSDSSPAKEAPVVVREPQIEMVDVLIPVQNIENGSVLEPHMFRREKRPKLGLSPSIVRDFEEIKSFYARALIVADQPLHSDYITSVRPNSQISPKIPPGYRAVTIRVDAKSGVEGWALPGAKVDVVWVAKIKNEQAITVIVENAEVLSADRSPDANLKPGAPVPSTITLLVTAEDAKKIQLASVSGTLSLSLRGDQDPTTGDPSQIITIPQLFKGGSGAEERPAQVCQSKVKTCSGEGNCEELCLGSDGKLVPIVEER